jgi:hypothetical protein
MKFLRPSTALLAAPLLLALAIPADDVGFHPKADAGLKKVLKLEIELKPEKIDFTVNGESQPPDNLGGFGDKTALVKLKVGVTDRYVQIKDGRPTDLLRTFDDLSLSYEAGEDKGDAEKFDRLEGKTVRFKWNAESEEYEKSFHESEGDDALLENLSEDMDLCVLLPAKKVADGDTWEVPGAKLLALFLPGGMPGDVAAGSDQEEFRTVTEETRTALAKLLQELKVQCKYKGAHDEGGTRVGEIHLTFSGKDKIDLSHLIQRLSEMDDNDVHPDVDANANLDLQGEGTLLWDLAAGHVHSFEMGSDVGIDVDVKASAEVEGDHFEMKINARLAGKASWSLSTSKP